MRIATQLAARFPGHRATIDHIHSDTTVLTHKLGTTKSFLAADDPARSTARQHHNEDDAAATLSILNVDLFKVPPAQCSQYIAKRLNRTLREFNDALKEVSWRIMDSKDRMRALKARR